jgi:hypothetical protein
MTSLSTKYCWWHHHHHYSGGIKMTFFVLN